MAALAIWILGLGAGANLAKPIGATAAPGGCLQPTTDLVISQDGGTAAYFASCDPSRNRLRQAYLFLKSLQKDGSNVVSIPVDAFDPVILGFSDSDHVLYLATNEPPDDKSPNGAVLHSLDIGKRSDQIVAKIPTEEPIWGGAVIRGDGSFLISASSPSRYRFVFVVYKDGTFTTPIKFDVAKPIAWLPSEKSYLIASADRSNLPNIILKEINIDGSVRQKDSAPSIITNESLYFSYTSSSTSSPRLILRYVPGAKIEDHPGYSMRVLDLSKSDIMLHDSIPGDYLHWPNDVAISDDGETVAIKYSDQIEVRRVSDMDLLVSYPVLRGQGNTAMAFSPDGRTLVLGLERGKFLVLRR